MTYRDVSSEILYIQIYTIKCKYSYYIIIKRTEPIIISLPITEMIMMMIMQILTIKRRTRGRKRRIMNVIVMTMIVIMTVNVNPIKKSIKPTNRTRARRFAGLSPERSIWLTCVYTKAEKEKENVDKRTQKWSIKIPDGYRK